MKVELAGGRSFVPTKGFVAQSIANWLWGNARISAQKIMNVDCGISKEKYPALPVVDEPVTLVIERGDKQQDILSVTDVLIYFLAYTEVCKETGLFKKKRTRLDILCDWRDQYIVH